MTLTQCIWTANLYFYFASDKKPIGLSAYIINIHNNAAHLFNLESIPVESLLNIQRIRIKLVRGEE